MKYLKKGMLVTLLAVLLLLLGCKAKINDERPLIVTSIYPYQMLLQELMGDAVRVQSLIPAAASPHTWSAKPKDLKALDGAQLLVMNGLGLEEQLTNAFEERAEKLVNISSLIKLAPSSDADSLSQPDSEHKGQNPHIWLSPQKMIRVVLMLADELQKRFPDQKLTINQNAVNMVNSLSEMHQQISKERAAINNPILITYHDSFHYFADDYDIRIPSSVQQSPGKEPTAKELAYLGAIIKTMHIKTIFVEPQMDQRSAKVLADEFDLKIMTLDPLGHSFKAKRITDLIWTNWQRIKMGLQGE